MCPALSTSHVHCTMYMSLMCNAVDDTISKHEILISRAPCISSLNVRCRHHNRCPPTPPSSSSAAVKMSETFASNLSHCERRSHSSRIHLYGTNGTFLCCINVRTRYTTRLRILSLDTYIFDSIK